jgi:cation diffusion facilitator CzcD-associated flavoprotein CzcO
MASKHQIDPYCDSFELDIIIAGAGISGINAAYRLQERCPNLSYIILESRDPIGGTWDMFRYPGIRSDSDLYTLGFAWRPWTCKSSIVEGDLILDYLEQSAAAHGIDKRIQFGHHIESADWSSAEKKWNLTSRVRGNEEARLYKCNFVVFRDWILRMSSLTIVVVSNVTQNYETPLQTEIPGISNFTGTTIHPQFWPTDFNHTDKDIVVIGSGATAITLLSTLSKSARHVTILQRSPAYILSHILARTPWSNSSRH